MERTVGGRWPALWPRSEHKGGGQEDGSGASGWPDGAFDEHAGTQILTVCVLHNQIAGSRFA